MTENAAPVLDMAQIEHIRDTLGAGWLRTLDYFREDAAKSIAGIEEAMRNKDAVGMIGPAELLTSEAMQMGALGLASLAEQIEVVARDCVEWHQRPDQLLETVVQLRGMFQTTIEELDRELAGPLVRKGAGEKAGARPA